MISKSAVEPLSQSGDIRYQLLGVAGVDLGCGFRRLPGRRQNVLFAVLALVPGVPVSVDRLVELVWRAQPHPRDPAAALQSQVSRLRRSVGGAGALAHQESSYVLTCSPEDVDVHRYERLVAQARTMLAGGAPRDAVACSDAASRLWRGDPFAELSDLPSIRDETFRLGELRLDECSIRAQARIELGQHAAAISDLRRLTVGHPGREDFWALLALALYRADRTSDALDAVRSARQALSDDLGLEPGPTIRRLEAEILSHSPNLAPAPQSIARFRLRRNDI